MDSFCLSPKQCPPESRDSFVQHRQSNFSLPPALVASNSIAPRFSQFRRQDSIRSADKLRTKAPAPEPRQKTREEEEAEKREESLKEKVGQLESLTHEMRKNFYKELMNVRHKGPRMSQGGTPFEEDD